MFYMVGGYHPGWKFPVEIGMGTYRPPIFSWTHCPFCNGELPGYEQVMRRILEDDDDGN